MHILEVKMIICMHGMNECMHARTSRSRVACFEMAMYLGVCRELRPGIFLLTSACNCLLEDSHLDRDKMR